MTIQGWGCKLAGLEGWMRATPACSRAAVRGRRGRETGAGAPPAAGGRGRRFGGGPWGGFGNKINREDRRLKKTIYRTVQNKSTDLISFQSTDP